MTDRYPGWRRRSPRIRSKNSSKDFLTQAMIIHYQRVAENLSLNDCAALSSVSRHFGVKDLKQWARVDAQYLTETSCMLTEFSIPSDVVLRSKNKRILFNPSGEDAGPDTPTILGIYRCGGHLSVFVGPSFQLDDGQNEDIFFQIFAKIRDTPATEWYLRLGSGTFILRRDDKIAGFNNFIPIDVAVHSAINGRLFFRTLVYRPRTRLPSITQRLFPDMQQILADRKLAIEAALETRYGIRLHLGRESGISINRIGVESAT